MSGYNIFPVGHTTLQMGFPSESKKGDCQDITYFQSGIQFYKWGFPLKVRKEIVRIKHIFSRGHTILHSGGYILQTTYTVPLNADFNKKKNRKAGEGRIYSGNHNTV